MDTTQNQELEAIKEKIAKLLRKSESAKEINSMAEASAFANKATDLLMQYNLKLHDVNMEAGLPQEPEIIILTEFISSFYNINTTDGTTWATKLANIIALNNLCKLVITKYPNGDILLKIIGTLDNAKNVAMMIESMIPVARNVCSKEWSTYHGTVKRNKFRRDFLQGFSLGLHRSYKAQEMAKPEYGALIRTNEVAVNKVIHNDMGPLKNVKRRNVDTNDAFLKGVKAGEEFKLNKELS